MTVKIALMFDNTLSDDVREQITTTLVDIKNKSAFEADFVMHMEIDDFCKLYL